MSLYPIKRYIGYLSCFQPNREIMTTIVSDTSAGSLFPMLVFPVILIVL